MEVKIRPLEEKDAYTSVKWRNIPEIWAYTEFAPTREIKIEDELAWIKKVMAEANDRRFAILVDDQYVGNVYLTGIKDGEAEYHIFIGDKNYWGKGVAKEASRLVIEFAKNNLKLSRIRLKVRKSNQPAIPLYEKLGFKASGEEGDFLLMEMKL